MATDYKKSSYEDLTARSMELQAQEDKIRDERKVVNRELAFRGNLEQRSKALKGMSKEDIERIVALTQTVSDAGDVASEEVVVGTQDDGATTT